MIRTFEGIDENGQVRLQDTVALPESARVYVIIPELEAAPRAFIASPRLAHREQAAAFVKEIVGLTNDGLSLHAGT